MDARRRAEQGLHFLSADDDKPLVYLLLGSTGSGRRQVLADLIEGGLSEGDRPAVLISSTEEAYPADASLPDLGTWALLPEAGIDAEFPEGASHIFIVLDGRLNPVDQIEAWKGWLEARGIEVGRVYCVVNCRLAEKHPKLFAWYEACIHFSDVVLLNCREGVSNKWIGEFKARFTDKYYPCLFEFVKAGRVDNPALVLAPVARRMSHVFDETEWIADEDEEDQEDSEEEVEMKPEEDPYFERRNGGRRVHEIPHIADFLPKPPEAGGPTES